MQAAESRCYGRLSFARRFTPCQIETDTLDSLLSACHSLATVNSASPPPLDVRSATARAQIIELHLVFDFFVHRHHFFPIDFELSPKHDGPDERISAVR